MTRTHIARLVLATLATATWLHTPGALATEADDQIESSFKKTYTYKTYLKDDDVDISAKNGIVTLSGTVAAEPHKTLAHETAASLPGVLRVDNQLATKAEEAAADADTWIRRKVNLSLMFHRNVSSGSVEVKDSVVTLKGEADSIAQKELTAEYAADIEGVKSVKNEMTVAAAPVPAERSVGEKIDDASITAQVKTALLTHRSTSAVKTKVATWEGEVTLTGIASNAAEKSLVTKLVSDIQGVSKVKNEMTVNEVKTN